MAPGSKPASRTQSNMASSSRWAVPASHTNSNSPNSHVPFQQSHQVKCNNPGCEELFENDKAMRRHKKYSTTHFYCYKCDVDCEDWEDLTKHKVDMMAPYVEGRIEASKDDMPRHIVCEFCGEDFKSFGGRKIHRQTVHPADQDVQCPGCKHHFLRAAHMIVHIETNCCSAILPSDLYRSICHKFVVKQVLKAPDKFLQPTGVLTDGAETNDHDDGGVSLLDQEDEARLAGFLPLDIPARPGSIGSPTPSNATMGTWHGLPSQTPLAKSMRSISINSAAPHAKTATATGRHLYAGRGNSGYGGETASHTPGPYAGPGDSGYGGETASNMSRPSAWNTTNSASQSLFPDASPTPPQPGDWSAVLAKREEEALNDDKSNIMKARWWDPASSDYNPHVFWDANMGGFTCRFPDCVGDGMAFAAMSDLQDHMKMFHLPENFQCPGCFKRFNKPSSLVAHAESTRKCNVRAGGGFKSLIDEISGGLLNVNHVPVPKIYRPDTAVVKFGKEPSHGIKDVEFKGKQFNA